MDKAVVTRRRKRSLTLIEIIVVITLIGLVMGALAYNYQGSLEKGRAFTSEQRRRTIEEVLTLQVAEDPDSINDLRSNWKEYLGRSPLVKDAQELSKDGWGQQFEIDVREDVNSGEIRIEVISKRLEQYNRSRSGR